MGDRVDLHNPDNKQKNLYIIHEFMNPIQGIIDNICQDGTCYG